MENTDSSKIELMAYYDSAFYKWKQGISYY